MMNFIKRLCGKGGDAKLYKGEPFLAFGKLQQAIPQGEEVAFGLLYVDCACKSYCLFNRVQGWARGGRFGSSFGGHPLPNFCATLNQQMAIMVGNPCAIFHNV